MYITFRSQGEIGEVAKEMGFDEDISLKFTRLDSRDGERWSINLEAELKLEFPKIFENADRLQGINHSCFTTESNFFPFSLKSKSVVSLVT